MSNKMLIDASHPEETRVVVVRGNRIEEFDFESEHKKQLKGNIYLARVTRVEPSLQAAFVEYGGNRHGFLAFSEIHPDYYQIPVADRLALLEEEEKAARQDDEGDDQETEKKSRNKRSRRSKKEKVVAAELDDETISETVESDDLDDNDQLSDPNEDTVESVGAEDAMEEVPMHQRAQRRQYKIQEVIKRRQILLVQVVKEERGNKGAALTTYLSLAGRYSVLMPNTARGGGISRKITNVQDRRRLKEIVKDLHVPKGMGVILRTAGANRTKAEVKRDYEYLMRLWENVRGLTLESVAPSLVYEEGSLIKRSIRDLYNKDIGEILVSGDQGYREAKDFMRMLMPSHAKVVQPYKDPLPIFARNGIETQLDAMLQPEVTLKSGGYLVINQTEALVAIDVNSGRSTKEHSIEETACQTNLEAAEEVARQLRLRDLAGLVVIDFIDMEEKRNNRLVEKKLKDCLKDDRARIQVGRISHFGLMEMSRQRIRASVLESTMQLCPHCHGTGYIRSDSSLALHVIRSIEEYLLRNPNFNITVRTPVVTALYVLNHKRQVIADLEQRFGLTINFEADNDVGAEHLVICRGTAAEGTPAPVLPTPIIEDEPDLPEIEEETEQAPVASNNNNNRRKRHKRDRRNDNNEEQTSQSTSPNSELSEDDNKRRRRRGRRGGRRNRDGEFERRRLPYAEPVGEFAERALSEVIAARRQQRRIPAAELVGFTETELQQNVLVADAAVVTEAAPIIETAAPTQEVVAEKPQKKRGRKSKAASETADTTIVLEQAQDAEPVAEAAPVTEEVKAPVKRKRKTKAEKEAELKALNEANSETLTSSSESVTEEQPQTGAVEQAEEKPAKKTTRRGRKSTKKEVEPKAEAEPKAEVEPTANEENTAVEVTPEETAVESVTKTKRKSTKKKSEPEEMPSSDTSPEPVEEEKPKRMGWWQRKGFF